MLYLILRHSQKKSNIAREERIQKWVYILVTYYTAEWLTVVAYGSFDAKVTLPMAHAKDVTAI